MPSSSVVYITHDLAIYHACLVLEPPQHDAHVRHYEWAERLRANRAAVDAVHNLVKQGAFK